MSTPSSAAHLQLDDISTRNVLEGFARLHHLVLVTDHGGRIVWVSDELGLICGGTEGLIGQNWSALLSRVPRPGTATTLQRQMHEHELLQNVRLDLPPHAGGGPLSVDLSAFRVDSNVEGAPLTVAIVRRVEDRERSRRDLQNQLGYLSAVLDASPDAVLSIDHTGFITYANAAAGRLVGEDAPALVGKPVGLLLPQARSLGTIASSIDPQAEITGEEVELHRPDGEPTWLSISTRILRAPDGSAAGSVAFLRDVTERRGVQERLERKNAELESTVHSVSHDLRSPLVSLLGFSRLLRQDYEKLLDDAGRHFLDRIEQAGRTMEALIHDLLELSRIGRPGACRTLVDPRGVLLQLYAELKPRLDERKVSLRLPESPPLVLCDRTRIYQVFSNLVGNALHHMGARPDPVIVVEISEEAEHHHIVVRDNGRGIAPEHHDRIFEVFHTVESRAETRRSTGIGLAIVKKIAEAHDGRVWVESCPGEGAAFHLLLPRK